MPKFSLKDARNFYRRAQYGLSMANYTAILKHLPAEAPKLETEFLLCFEQFRQELRIENYSIDQINDYFLLFSDIFKFSAEFYVQWANFLSVNGLYEEASLCFMQSLRIQDAIPQLDASIINAAYSGLRGLKDHLVDQWHFRMLNDRVRNESYDRAIKLAIRSLKKQKSKTDSISVLTKRMKDR
uniref:Tetratricopeptide repeat protein n=1 Tax=Romanomermis culicivorax TaxID=13658 RepID=A0A915HTS7_ROMCU